MGHADATHPASHMADFIARHLNPTDPNLNITIVADKHLAHLAIDQIQKAFALRDMKQEPEFISILDPMAQVHASANGGVRIRSGAEIHNEIKENNVITRNGLTYEWLTNASRTRTWEADGGAYSCILSINGNGDETYFRKGAIVDRPSKEHNFEGNVGIYVPAGTMPEAKIVR